MKNVPIEQFEGSVAGSLLMTMAAAGLLPYAQLMEAFGIKPIGYRKNGQPIWPMGGGDANADFESTMQELLGEMRKANKITEGEAAKPEDGGRAAAAQDGKKAIAASLGANDETKELETMKADRLARLEGHVEAMARMQRDMGVSASKARIAASDPGGRPKSRLNSDAWVKAHPYMAANWSDYQAGEFLTGLQDVKNIGDGLDVDTVMRGKAKLTELGVWHGTLPSVQGGYHFVDGEGKATLGTTNATGGFVLPNNLVDTVVKPATQKAVYQTLIRIINGVAVRGVDQPYRLNRPARATFQDWGTTKENVNETYGSYSAVLGTLARIMDISKQYARFSAGAAEQDVLDELTRAMILGENYYILAGAGTGSVGSGDPTYGVYTALAAASAFNGYTTAFSPVATTLAGSAAAGFATALGALAVRSREASAIVVDAVTFWAIIAQGTDTAGFWQSPTGGPTGFTKTASGGIAYWNVPLYYDANLNDNTGTTKRAIVGEWDALKMYRGMEFRIDSSDVAGTRWDQNLIGFRAEEEIGLHAGTAVNTGAFQLITGIIA